MTKYPECEKWRVRCSDAELIQDFVAFLTTKEIELCSYHEAESDLGWDWMPIRMQLETLIYEHFGIDEKKLEEERRAILAEARDKQEEIAEKYRQDAEARNKE